MNYGRIVSSFLVLAASCNATDQRSRSYSFNNEHETHTNLHTTSSSPQLINFNPHPNMYPDLSSPSTLSSSAPSNIHLSEPSAPHFPENESGPTSPHSKRRSNRFENNYMTVETSPNTEPKPGYYKSQPSLHAAMQEYEHALTQCDTAYQELKTTSSKLIEQPTQTQESLSPTPVSQSKFGFSLKTEEEQTRHILRQKVAPHVLAETQQREKIIGVTATLQTLSKHLKATTEKLSGQKP